ncbi:cobyrinate a,c-diamide synthase [Clostridiales bacterium]|nr:cobyrinate a,c-diamide synthase [Clostridiales bacterium]
MAVSRIIVGGAESSSGKTTVVCALLRAFKNRGIRSAAVKCGPDYIDPMFHEKALKTPSKNIDLFLSDENMTKWLLAKHCEKADICLMEGVMGYYDGLDIGSDKASTYEIAMATGTPAIIVINARGAALTLVSLIEGMLNFRRKTMIRGVILNNISKPVFERIKPVIEQATGTKVIGFMPADELFSLKSRRLGLEAPDGDIDKKLESLAETAEQTIDIDAIISISNEAKELKYKIPFIPYVGRARIFAAVDDAFSFYYRDNLELLKKMGAEIEIFSPLRDIEIPPNADGIILGGGYPELYSSELSANKKMRASIKTGIENGIPCLAECGGFMYLNKSIDNIPMVGVFEENAYDTGKLLCFGYVELKSQNSCLNGIKGHEFHYWTTDNNGCECTAVKPSGKRSWPCMRLYKNTIAGFTHLYYCSKPDFARAFIERCVNWRK